MNIQQIRSYFPGLDNCLYFNTASYAIGNTFAAKAYNDINETLLSGKFELWDYENEMDQCKIELASFINASPHTISQCSYLSNACGMIAQQLEMTTNDNIVMADIEFSSSFYPWYLLKEKGYEIRLAPSTEGIIDEDALIKLIDEKTRVVSISAVQSSSGYTCDIKSISQKCRECNAWLFVDASQAMGVIPVDVQDWDVDFLATVSYKYMLGARGITYMYIKEDLLDSVKPVTPGWRAAKKPFESFYGPEVNISDTASKMDNSVSWILAHAEKASLSLINKIGLESMIERNQFLRKYFYEALDESCLPHLKPSPRNRSNNIIIPLQDNQDISNTLKKNNIRASIRQSNLRISYHFYNTIEEIDALIACLRHSIY